jgi:ABC-type hemin transport system ATPase subunit
VGGVPEAAECLDNQVRPQCLPYANWSNGGKARVKLSCLFAVVEILKMMGSTSYNIQFLDEIFSAVDTSGKEGLFNVLASLRDKGKCVYTNSHTPLVNSVAPGPQPRRMIW